MFARKRIALLLMLVVLPAAPALALSADAAPQEDRAKRVLFEQHSLIEMANSLGNRLKREPNNTTTRDLTNASLLLLCTKGSPAAAEVLLRHVFAVQDMDKSSRGYGTVPWKIDDPSIKDPNAIEFAMQALGAVFLGYGDSLSPEFKKEADEHLRAAMVALANHHVAISYTNIFLMNTMSTLELGEYLHDDASLQRGYKQWHDWEAYTSANGVHEFDSPTYYAVDLGSLNLGYVYVKDAATHQQIQAVLDMFWRDIAANYLAPAQHIVGAHSRDYYFLTGRGGLEYYLYVEGLYEPGNEKFADQFLEKVDFLESERRGGYRVPQEILDIARLPERTIQQRWDESPELSRYTYLTQSFAIGFASGKYGDQDKMFATDLTGHAPLPSITLVPDDLDSPYGIKTAVDRSGHAKPNHLPLNLSGVQQKGTALLVSDLDPAVAFGQSTYATNLILPANGTHILLDKKAIKVSPSLNEPASMDSVVGVRSEHSCFVARVVSVDSLNGSKPTIALKADSAGLSKDVLRLVIYHAQSSFTSADIQHLHVTFLVEASACQDDAELATAMVRLREAKVHSLVKDGAWQGTAELGTLKLALTEDAAKRRTASASINGSTVTLPVFTLNDRPMGLQPQGQGTTDNSRTHAGELR